MLIKGIFTSEFWVMLVAFLSSGITGVSTVQGLDDHTKAVLMATLTLGSGIYTLSRSYIKAVAASSNTPQG